MKFSLLILSLLFTTTTLFSQLIHHDLEVKLDIKSNTIEVIDNVHLSAEYLKKYGFYRFTLNKDFKVQKPSPPFVMFNVIDEVDRPVSDGSSVKYQVNWKFMADSLDLTLRYSGKVVDEIKKGALEYARGFSDTRGIISEKGVFLSGATQWIPSSEEELFTYTLTVIIDSAWSVVSQGRRTENQITGSSKRIKYDCIYPMEEVYLIAAKWHEYGIKAGKIDVQAFLRAPDEKLAMRYLQATGRYLRTYENMIGPYPFSKFAVVENFWETGYGMPSFTLLGPKVIRFPFILFTSYPHELLHNWWGNSVYVNYAKGNWCEGITAYMADHYMKEQRGQAHEYRRTTLQKYADYVDKNNDIPVIEFRSRQNPAQEAIGYGKCLMFNHMLRLKTGDETFIKAYSDFYKNYKFKHTTFDDIRESFETVSGTDLEPFFYQWLKIPGAPDIDISGIEVKESSNGYDLSFTLSQNQPGLIYDVEIPIAVFFSSGKETSLEMLNLSVKKKEFKLSYKDKPLRIVVDPFFDVFRKLDRDEVPTTLSQTFGAKTATLILPAASPLLDKYREMADMWKKSQEVQGKVLTVVEDKNIKNIPSNESVWILGFENKFYPELKMLEKFGSHLPDSTSGLIKELSKTGSVVYSIPNPGNKELTLTFVGSNMAEAVPGLVAKLPHYGKYGYLGFSGNAPTNKLKGELPVLNSPMKKDLFSDVKSSGLSGLKPRKALGQ